MYPADRWHVELCRPVRTALCILAAIATMAMLAVPPDTMSLRLATGKRYARVTVYVPQRPEHRALVVHGFVGNDEGELIWERTSGVELDGERSKKQHIFEWPGPPPGLMEVRAEAIGICGSAQGAAFVGF